MILSLLLWRSIARVVRGVTLSLREREFVDAARAIGASNRRIIARHIVPNCAGPIIVNATLVVAEAILDLDHFSLPIGWEDLDHVQRVVHDHLSSRDQGFGGDVRGQVHSHLPARGNYIDRAVVVGSEVDAEGRGWLREFLDLFGERLDLVPLGPEGVGQLLVLRGCAL